MFNGTVRVTVRSYDRLYGQTGDETTSNSPPTASFIARVHRLLLPTEAPSLLRIRFQIINIWRPISHAAVNWQIALCNSRSVDFEKDSVPVALIYADFDPSYWFPRPEHSRGNTASEIH
ncbi:hypothetical protein DFJ58DRAFT_795711 [Suillus subalutaceus]|uniref:uncharacterized protein n=1 Tax=Suillus subalutaceus TaxID=48586 RepID=UPI001B861F1F|nr:uncharacterized protein DFJ58DRAFT_795711 [Suillus subalutaceus]KAG1848969.1 hypothetical protein DFJ58DRAFT_795711 [Suillus subalutaceus]